MVDLSFFNIATIVFALAYFFYLAYVTGNPKRRKAALSKRKKEMPAYSHFFDKMYSSRFLLIWALLTIANLIDAFVDAYKRAHPGDTSAGSVGLLVVCVLVVIDICLLVNLWKKK